MTFNHESLDEYISYSKYSVIETEIYIYKYVHVCVCACINIYYTF